MQHAHPAVLKRMNRKGTGDDYLQLIRALRKEIPNISIRSTFICGFPGETEEQSLALFKFLEKAQLDYAGFFAYSKEESLEAFLDGIYGDAEKSTVSADESEKRSFAAFMEKYKRGIAVEKLASEVI